MWNNMKNPHCVKSARIRSYSGPHFPAFELNMVRIFPQYGHFHAVPDFKVYPCLYDKADKDYNHEDVLIRTAIWEKLEIKRKVSKVI